MRRYRWVWAGGIVLAGAAITLAVLSQGGSGGNLAGTKWTLVALHDQAPLPGSGPITLEFETEGRAGGNSGCNSYGAGYVTRQGSLTITDLTSTLRACVDPRLNEQEAFYLSALASVTAYEIAREQLILKGAGGAIVLVFVRA